MKKILFTITLSLIIIVSAVAIKNVYSCDIPIGNRGIKAALETGELDVLFIGSSTFRSNIDVGQLDEHYNNRDYIISYGGNQAVAENIQYDEIKQRAKNNCKLMVFEFEPLMITEDVKLSDSRVIWDLSFEGKLNLFRELSKAGNADLSVMYEYFVTSGMDDLLTYPLTEPFYSTRYYKGAKTDITPSSGLEYLENEQFDISDYEVVEAQEQAIVSLVEKCKRDSQELVLLECPHYYRLEEDSTYQKYLQRITELTDRLEVRFVKASDVPFDNHNPEYYEDMSHMSYEGRKKYTEELIKVLGD